MAQEPPLSTGDAEARSAARRGPILEYRVAIETGATLLAAERTEPADLERLEELVQRMADASDFEDYRRADIRFHIGVAEVARSPRLVEAMTEVQGQMSGLIALIAHPDQVLTHSNAQHERLVAKLAAPRQRREPYGTMREHIEGTEHILAGLLPRPMAR